MDFASDGSKFYIVGTQDDLLRQYDMSPAWDLASATYTVGKDKSVNFLESAPRGFSFRKDDMSQFWLVGDTDKIYQWSSPSGIASFSSYTGINYEAGHREGSSPLGITFEYDGDGTRFWICDAQSRKVYEWRCTEPWNTSSATRTGKLLDLVTYDAGPREVGFKTDGTRLFFTGTQNNKMFSFNLTIPWDITSINVASLSSTPFTVDDGIEGFYWKPDGSSFYVVGTQGDAITQYDCSVEAWNVGIATTNGTLAYASILGNSGDPRAIVFNEDGTRLSVVDTQSDYVNELILTTPWDIDGGHTVGGRFYAMEANPVGLAYGNDYKRMYVLGDSSDRIYQFDLVTNKVLVNKRDHF
jgi:DNA-binding beta-propeller fold protein YncE